MMIFKEGFDRRGTAVMIDIPPDLPALIGVQADVEQLLLNLIGNARDATGAGDRVMIRAAFSSNAVELVVEDTGSGIHAEDLPKIQEPFFTTKANGHGLGLAICRSIVSQMAGRLSIDSTPGVGTSVRALFPLQVEENV
jgi:signal transduction histidine kinase